MKALVRKFSSVKIARKDYDILIVGAGPVGASLACALACTPVTSSLRIALVDAAPSVNLNQKLPEIPELRCSAINQASVSFFKALGVWDSMVQKRVSPYYKMFVWDGAGPASIQFDNKQNSDFQELGFIIENRVMHSTFHEKLKQFPNVEIYHESPVEHVSIPSSDFRKDEEDIVEVKTKNGIRFGADLVIGSDGASSLIRDTADISAVGWQYNQSGVVAVVEHPEPNTTAFQRFLPSGPVAILPMFGTFSNIVWSTNETHAKHLLKISPDEFLQELKLAFEQPIKLRGWDINASIKHYVPALPNLFTSPVIPQFTRAVGSRAAFPFKLTHATEYTRHRIALVGDSAHVVHPLAGQGLNLGYADSASIANFIIEAVSTGQDIGSYSVLGKYQRDRMSQNLTMQAGVDGLKRIFDSTLFPVALARNIGLFFADSLTPIKNQFVKQALGSVDVSQIGKCEGLL